MEYRFKVEKVSSLKYFFIEMLEEKYYLISRLSDDGWTVEMAQEIIDEIEASKTKPKESAYEWGSEDVIIVGNENGVFLFDLISERFGVTDYEKLWLRLTHDEFITFMKDFKQFIGENSK